MTCGPEGAAGEDFSASAVYGPHNRSRHLQDDEAVWDHNCWDNVPWDEEREREAEEIVAQQKAQSVLYQERHGNGEKAQQLRLIVEMERAKKKWLAPSPTEKDLEAAAQKWDDFYGQHERWFFKDRNWLYGEFREMYMETDMRLEGSDEEQAFTFPVPRNIVEVGCGAGNTVFPLWKERRADPNLEMIYACDFSPRAVELVKSFREFDAGKMCAFVHDLSAADEFPAAMVGKMDVITAIFVLSALKPEHIQHAFDKLYRLLRPGGLLLFRDYGRYDLTQLRLKPERLIDDDFYFRGDGTTVYYFTTQQVRQFAQASGFKVIKDSLHEDRRLITNRLRKLKMYRNWIQGKFFKPE